ncbi:TRAP transporter large permease [Siccirubricoccus sp. KC 17139]|uniref:TRAP transporter large permease protein n=1 Tax=Siccirubricoccus soli TaxID=2899147 RepID=A0ABT1D6F5_9PROT|nr:TRAP transporter large permease [Siccirubricoccus soli]MCO6416860.1 TRAP transporter large permease [Siccirubricoccus soli]MCP2682995.1 TRAP transporter large permease [Siccirubricoccus soli]
MIGVGEAAMGFGILVVLLFLGLHVATAMFLVAVLGASLYLSPALVEALGTQLWASMEDYVLLSIPLYILLGEILVRSGSTDRLYRSLADWLNILPGGLLHTNVGASAIFSAVSGSSVATAATVATVALPSFRTRKYDERLVLGSIAAGASLGNLIPPGIALIVYGAMTNTSVGQLYAGAVVPGIVMTALFMATIMLIALVRPGLVRQQEAVDRLAVRLRRLVDLLPPLVIFAIIMGSIYTGWATVTESAALAVLAALPIAALYGRLSIRMLHECFVATASLTAMSLLILSIAFYLNFVLGLLGVTPALGAFVAQMDVSQLGLILALTVFYLLLGIFFETLPMLVGTVPVVFPVIMAAGIDPVWFGVFIVLMCEISLISPPVGMTLYVIQAVRKEGTIAQVFAGTVPFFLAMVVMTGLLIAFPEMATWLPRLTYTQ